MKPLEATMSPFRLRLRPPSPFGLLALAKPQLPQQTRPFSLPSLSELTSPPTPRSLHAARTLPYPSELVYSVISDIGSYSTFLPFCSSSRVHTWTTPPSDPFGDRYPATATLTVGWGPFKAESYTSRVYCVPGSVVEAVSGEAQPSTDSQLLRRLGYGAEETGAASANEDGGLFRSLVTRWDVRPGVGAGPPRTDVSLKIRYLFANPLHQVAVGGVADQVAGMMIEAFESRAQKLYDGWLRKELEKR